MRSVALILAVAVLFSLGAAPEAAADVITLKGGRRVVGTVVDKDADPVEIRTRYGVLSFLQSKIASIEIKPTPWEEFDRRLRKVDKSSLEELNALLEWAKRPENGKYLRSQVRRLYRRILRLDPDHEEARRELGYQRYEGRWVSRKEMERIKEEKAREREARKQALSEREKREAFRRRARKDVGLQMKLNRKEDEEMARVINDACGSEMFVATSRRISIAGTFDRAASKPLLQLGEKAITQVCLDLELGADHNPGRSGLRGVYTHYFAKMQDRKALITFVRNHHGGITEAFYQHLMRGKSGLAANSGRPAAVSVDRGDNARKDALLHNLGHCIAGGLTGSNNLSPWLQEGFGMYMSIRFLGDTGHFCTTITKYAQDMEIAKKRGEEGWALILKEQVEKRFFPTFRALSQKKLNLLDQKDLARSWGLIKFFMARDPKKFCNFMRYTGNKYEVQVRALKAAFGIEAARFDDLVNEWIVATF